MHAMNAKPGLTFVVDNFLLKRKLTPAPTEAPTAMIEEFVVGSDIACTDGNCVGPNIGAKDNVDFALSPDGAWTSPFGNDALSDGNWTFSPFGNDTLLTFLPDEIDPEL